MERKGEELQGEMEKLKPKHLRKLLRKKGLIQRSIGRTHPPEILRTLYLHSTINPHMKINKETDFD